MTIFDKFTNFTAIKKPSNSKIIELFRINMGNKTEVSEALNVSRTALYNWIESDKDLKQAIEQQEESNIDYVESLQKTGFQIDNPNAKSTCSCGDSFH